MTVQFQAQLRGLPKWVWRQLYRRLPKHYRNRRRREQASRWYEEQRAVLRERGADRYDRHALERDYWTELQVIEWEEEVAYTRKLLDKANKLRVPVPTRYVYEDGRRTVTEYWSEGPFGWEQPYLNSEGIALVRQAIHEEESRRSERVVRLWIPLLSTLVALVGALAALVSVL